MHYMYSPKGDVTVVFRGMPFALSSDHPSYEQLIEALEDDDVDTVEEIVFAGQRLADDLAGFGYVQVYEGHVTYQGQVVHGYLVDQILLARRNGIDATPFIRFLDRVMQNPDGRARSGLFDWIEKSQMPLTSDGCFLAWKAINHAYYDHYTGRVYHGVGTKVSQPRGQCDPDPDQTCSRGLHFCAKEYLSHYHSGNSRIVVVKIDPADVVAFPRDYDLAKGRACAYEVVEEVDPRLVAQYFDGVEAYVA